MKCIGKYTYKEKENDKKEICHYPIGIEEDVDIEQPEYYITKECTEHENCTFTSVRGIPFHGSTLDINAMVFVEDEIHICNKPLFYSYEHPPSSSTKQYDFDSSFELLSIINTPIETQQKRPFTD